ncbi:ubiquitin-conjugating enzyme E2 D2-like isoform X11 [Dreissena polymorpha]|uniref:ubiquitin-conjugating enzyme E2 D2-like isoform X10 n=1 Tax=Dreissena polymorpha TaxID=45954 RepID=UPI002264D4C6|nr:ubiquitin-conjugating enzyme E2 D2-like isoform X10 [Dreissena polymorpha]XP_052267035.1 ubiquitin-conjugating enzyme E2 D2-like isoform X11 [Dreissena polymorpha]
MLMDIRETMTNQLQRVSDELPQRPGFSAGPLEDDLLHWKASIMGPVWFLTEVYHPNVDSKGKICVDFLQHEWKPSFSISYILLAICSLLALPNAENPVVQEIADVYLHDKPTFDKIAVEMTLEHAKPDF